MFRSFPCILDEGGSEQAGQLGRGSFVMQSVNVNQTFKFSSLSNISDPAEARYRYRKTCGGWSAPPLCAEVWALATSAGRPFDSGAGLTSESLVRLSFSRHHITLLPDLQSLIFRDRKTGPPLFPSTE